MMKISKIFFWLELVASILNIDIKIYEKNWNQIQNHGNIFTIKNYIKQGLKEIKTELWEVQFVIV